jgi:uncharacterized protein (TIGR03790 family)
MKLHFPLFCCFVLKLSLALLASCNLSTAADPAELRASTKPTHTVVVVANTASADSLAVAHHYIQQRNLNPENLISLPLSLQESITRHEFVESLWNPLRQQLLSLGLIEGRSAPPPSDADGYLRYVPINASIDYLVICKDVPLKIQSSPSRMDPSLLNRLPVQLRTTQASVDSELAFIAAPSFHLPGPARNPLFEAGYRSHTDSTLSLSVTRLDGPCLQSVLNLIDRTLEAEKTPFIEGRAYIDLHPHHPLGNEWLQSAAEFLDRFGYPVFTEGSASHWSLNDPHDQPAVYLGWYQSKASAPFMAEHVTIPEGAIAGHIHSTSASTVRSTTEGWVGPLITRGVSVTFGNVFEPYLEMTLRPDLLISYLLGGANLGDAALFATPFLSWQGIVIGDPLYRPFNPSRIDFLFNQPISDSDNPYLKNFLCKRLATSDPVRAMNLANQLFLSNPDPVLAFHILGMFETTLESSVRETLLDYLAQNPHPEASHIPHYLTIATNLQKTGDPRAHSIHTNIRAMLPHYSKAIADAYGALLTAPLDKAE